jgi:hypothetical protein
MNHSKHQIDEDTTRFCPECNADWRGSLIPAATRHRALDLAEDRHLAIMEDPHQQWSSQWSSRLPRPKVRVDDEFIADMFDMC